MKNILEYVSQSETISSIDEYLLTKDSKEQSKFPDDMPKDVKHTDTPENIWELLVCLDDKGYEFTVDKGRFDDSTDVIIETKYNGVTVILSFIHPSEYLISMDKNDKEFYSLDSSRDLGFGNHFDFDLLDPLKYFKICLKNSEKRLATAKKGKRNRRTGEIEKNYSDISFYERKVARYTKYIEAIQ